MRFHRIHSLRDCEWVQGFWFAGPLSLRVRGLVAQDPISWFSWLHDVLPVDHLEVWAMLLWALWFRRNQYIFQSRMMSVGETVGCALKLLEDYRAAHAQDQLPLVPCPVSPWLPPPSGVVKLNCDAAVFRAYGCGFGCGILISYQLKVSHERNHYHCSW